MGGFGWVRPPLACEGERYAAALGRAPVARVQELAATVGRGAVMGVADVVPGVSGGTMALLLGIYNRFIAALAALDGVLLRRVLAVPKEGLAPLALHLRRVDFWFLVQLGIGIGLAVLAGAHVVGGLLEGFPRIMMAIFFGLILASVRLPWQHIPQFQVRHIAFGAAGAFVAALVASLPPVAGTPPAPFLLLGGAIAITAMLLPGISGSALLVLMGMYPVVLDAVRTLRIAHLALFAVGAGLGLLVSSRIIQWLLRHRAGSTLATLSGLMLGSLVRVWPWRTAPGFGEGAPVWPTFAPVLLAWLLLGAAISLGLERIAQRGGPVEQE